MVVGNRDFLQGIPGRGGERAQEETVEREREEAAERLLQWGLGWLLARQLGRLRLYVRRYARGHP